MKYYLLLLILFLSSCSDIKSPGVMPVMDSDSIVGPLEQMALPQEDSADNDTLPEDDGLKITFDTMPPSSYISISSDDTLRIYDSLKGIVAIQPRGKQMQIKDSGAVINILYKQWQESVGREAKLRSDPKRLPNQYEDLLNRQ